VLLKCFFEVTKQLFHKQATTLKQKAVLFKQALCTEILISSLLFNQKLPCTVSLADIYYNI